MNESQLTQHLREKHPSPAPQAWREAILEAAKTVPIERPDIAKPSGQFIPHLRWAAIAAIWLLLAWSQFHGQREDERLASFLTPSSFPCPLPISGEQIEMLLAMLRDFERKTDQALPYQEIHPTFEAHGPI